MKAMLTPQEENQLTADEREELRALRRQEAQLQQQLRDATPGPRTISQIAETLGLSRTRVHQIQNIALYKLRRHPELKDFLRK